MNYIKAYDLYRFKKEEYMYPEDMHKIITYLRSHGELHVSGKTVERLYADFSIERCCCWRSVTDEVLEEFAEWLDQCII